MAEHWKKLEHVKFEANCRDCKHLIRIGQTAWWLKNWGLLHPNCGLGSKRFVLSPVYTNNPSHDANPFEKIHEHTPDFHAAKLWRDSFDN